MINFNGNGNGKNKIINPIPMRYICKMTGEKDHEDDRLVKIQNLKLEENGSKILKTEWKFELDRVYEENITFQEVFENEVICSDFFSDIYENFRGTITFLSDSHDSFSNQKSDLNSFIKNSMGEIFRENSFCRSREVDQKVGMVTVSYIEVCDNKFKDYLKFEELPTQKEFTSLKFIEYSDEIVIEGLKEIEIANSEQMEYLLNLVSKKKNSKNKKIKNSSCTLGKKEKEKESLMNELITIKIYDSSKQILISKINFLLFKAYTLRNDKNSLENNILNYIVNTKENFNFFNSIQNSNYRCCKITRILKDTLEYGNNLTFLISPIELKYIVLLHDILNYVKIRKTNIHCEDLKSCIDPNFLEKFNSLSLNSFSQSNENHSEDKENISFFANSPLTNNSKSIYSREETKIKTKEKTQLNIERLKKIKDKSNVLMLLYRMNEKIKKK